MCDMNTFEPDLETRQSHSTIMSCLQYLSVDVILNPVQASSGSRLHSLHGCAGKPCLLLLLQKDEKLVKEPCGCTRLALHHGLSLGQVKGHPKQVKCRFNPCEVVKLSI